MTQLFRLVVCRSAARATLRAHRRYSKVRERVITAGQWLKLMLANCVCVVSVERQRLCVKLFVL